MKAKICSSNEYSTICDINAINVSLEGKFGRVIVEGFKDEHGMDRFVVSIEPITYSNEPDNTITPNNERIVICSGLLDFNNVKDVINNLAQ